MNNKVSVLVRLDASRFCAVLEVKGAVTAANCNSVLPVVERTRNLPGIRSVDVDLSYASTVDPEALSLLQDSGCTVSHGPANHPAAASAHTGGTPDGMGYSVAKGS